MPRIFVDVDGTLLEGQHGKPYGYRWNRAAIAGVQRFHQIHPDWPIVIWSRRGAAHARMAAARTFPDATAIAKANRLLRPDDIAVDNNPKEVPDLQVLRAGNFFSPEGFARMMLTHR